MRKTSKRELLKQLSTALKWKEYYENEFKSMNNLLENIAVLYPDLVNEKVSGHWQDINGVFMYRSNDIINRPCIDNAYLMPLIWERFKKDSINTLASDIRDKKKADEDAKLAKDNLASAKKDLGIK